MLEWRQTNPNRISGGMVRVFAFSVIDRWFESRSAQTKHYKIGIWFFYAKRTVLRSKSKDWLALNQNNVSKWSDKSTRRRVCQIGLYKLN